MMSERELMEKLYVFGHIVDDMIFFIIAWTAKYSLKQQNLTRTEPGLDQGHSQLSVVG